MVQLMSETKNYNIQKMVHHQRQRSLKNLSKLSEYSNDKLDYKLPLLTSNNDYYLGVDKNIEKLECYIYQKYGIIENSDLSITDAEQILNNISLDIDKKISDLESEFKNKFDTIKFERRDKKPNLKFKNKSNVIKL